MRPFLRYGPLGRGAARLLAPGWATGTLFHLALVVILMLLSLALGDELRNPNDLEMWAVLGVLLGMTYFPHLLVQLFKKRVSNRLVGYLLFSVLLFAIMPLLGILQNIGDVEMVAWSICFIPQAQPFLENHVKESTSLLLAWSTAGVYIIACLAFTLKPLLGLSKLEAEEIERISKEKEITS